ncbi:MAG TPA: SCP2 sterol-binding domain-containing protein [Acidimicrobiales bacterium]|jgi:putative sterol carrier protein
MAKFLSQEWLDLQQELSHDLPERPGATARIQYKIVGTSGGDVAFYTVIENGRIIDSTPGEDVDAEFSMSVPYAVFVEVSKGEIDVNAAFMQGRIKVTGSTATLLSLMPLTQSQEYKAAVDKLDAATQYA